jgi:WD40 repeat protein
LVFTRTYTENYFMAAITNTKFTIYEVYAEEESVNGQDLDIKDISSITVVCQRKQDVPFASVSSPAGLGRVTCIDFEDTGKRLVSGSINGMVVLWDNGDMRV